METIETLNSRLVEHYGIDSSTSQAMFRIVWANDELEKRLVEESDWGVRFLFPEVREVKKYPYLKDLYILERLVVVPDVNVTDLPTSKLSYEPIWSYCNGKREPVPPMWEATKFVVDALYAALGKKSMRKYIDSEKNTTKEGREQRIKDLQDELFGNETAISDAVNYKEGIFVPNKEFK